MSKSTAKKQMAEKADLKALSKAEILERCKPIESRIVAVKGWDAGVRMKNLTFQELVQLRIDAGDDADSKNAMVVAAVCEDLDISDAYALQKGNGAQFALLFAAVDEFLSCKITDEKIKN